MEVEEYIKAKGWKYRVVQSKRGPQALINFCPFCNSTDWSHFYISLITGQYLCHHCNNSGTLLSLKEHVGDLAGVSSFRDVHIGNGTKPKEIPMDMIDKATNNLLENGDALKYLKRRRFSQEAIIYFKLGYSEEKGNQWIWFPYIVNGEVKDIKKRSLIGKTFLRIGGESALLNEDIFKTNPKEVVITEGETDCIALWSAGYSNVVGATIGAQGINPNWIDLLDKVERVYICYDMDDAGIEGAYKLANRLGLEKCYRIMLPPGIKDVNEFFQKRYTLEHFKVLMEQSKPFHIQYVSTIGEEVSQLIYRIGNKETDEENLHVPWPKIDRLLNGFSSGDLICVAGMPGVGKTAFSINIAYLYAKQNIPILFFELEMRPQRIIPRIVSLHTGIVSEDVMQIDILQAAYRELKEFPFMFAYVYKKPNFDFCADTIRKGYNRYGIRFVVFDNLHFLVRSVSDQTKEVGIVVQSFKLLAEELGIPILLIARPRKTNRRIITNQDLKDSADIEGDSDSVILLHREPMADVNENFVGEGIFKPETLVRVSKARWGPGGDAHMQMDDKRCKITED
jgi:5S rRNA maturation endonuclease (ribonuclease M5)